MFLPFCNRGSEFADSEYFMIKLKILFCLKGVRVSIKSGYRDTQNLMRVI